MSPAFVKPLYNARCFADLPATVLHLLTGSGASPLAPDVLGEWARRYQTIIFFFIDAFGWRFFKQHQERSPFLQHIVRAGQVAQLTAQFPSTTAAHVTTIHTGLPVAQSGIYEWQYYEPRLDTLVTPLLFSFAGTRDRDTLKTQRVDPQTLYPTQTIYQTLRQHGVTSHVFGPKEFTPSTYSNIVFQGAQQVIPYKTLPEALTNLTHAFAARQTPAYFFFYYDRIDYIAHDYGPSSGQVFAEIDAFLTTMQRLFLEPLYGHLKNTLVILTADHGQVDLKPHTAIYLNQDPSFAEILSHLRRNRRGELLVPAGSPRDMFLYVEPRRLAETQTLLTQRLAGRAEVYLTDTLLEQGFFGPPPFSEVFLARLGNLVILPYAGEAVWWYEKDKFEQRFYGHHGGLTKEEMEIPLLVYGE